MLQFNQVNDNDGKTFFQYDSAASGVEWPLPSVSNQLRQSTGSFSLFSRDL